MWLFKSIKIEENISFGFEPGRRAIYDIERNSLFSWMRKENISSVHRKNQTPMYPLPVKKARFVPMIFEVCCFMIPSQVKEYEYSYNTRDAADIRQGLRNYINEIEMVESVQFISNRGMLWTINNTHQKEKSFTLIGKEKLLKANSSIQTRPLFNMISKSENQTQFTLIKIQAKRIYEKLHQTEQISIRIENEVYPNTGYRITKYKESSFSLLSSKHIKETNLRQESTCNFSLDSIPSQQIRFSVLSLEARKSFFYLAWNGFKKIRVIKRKDNATMDYLNRDNESISKKICGQAQDCTPRAKSVNQKPTKNIQNIFNSKNNRWNQCFESKEVKCLFASQLNKSVNRVELNKAFTKWLKRIYNDGNFPHKLIKEPLKTRGNQKAATRNSIPQIHDSLNDSFLHNKQGLSIDKLDSIINKTMTKNANAIRNQNNSMNYGNWRNTNQAKIQSDKGINQINQVIRIGDIKKQNNPIRLKILGKCILSMNQIRNNTSKLCYFKKWRVINDKIKTFLLLKKHLNEKDITNPNTNIRLKSGKISRESSDDIECQNMHTNDKEYTTEELYSQSEDNFIYNIYKRKISNGDFNDDNNEDCTIASIKQMGNEKKLIGFICCIQRVFYKKLLKQSFEEFSFIAIEKLPTRKKRKLFNIVSKQIKSIQVIRAYVIKWKKTLQLLALNKALLNPKNKAKIRSYLFYWRYKHVKAPVSKLLQIYKTKRTSKFPNSNINVTDDTAQISLKNYFKLWKITLNLVRIQSMVSYSPTLDYKTIKLRLHNKHKDDSLSANKSCTCKPRILFKIKTKATIMKQLLIKKNQHDDDKQRKRFFSQWKESKRIHLPKIKIKIKEVKRHQHVKPRGLTRKMTLRTNTINYYFYKWVRLLFKSSSLIPRRHTFARHPSIYSSIKNMFPSIKRSLAINKFLKNFIENNGRFTCKTMFRIWKKNLL